MKLPRKPAPPRWKDPEGGEVSLSYELEQEERVLQEILVMVDPSGDEAKLTPAFLLSLSIQHSATTFQLTHFRRLLLRIASQIQLTMWVSKTMHKNNESSQTIDLLYHHATNKP